MMLMSTCYLSTLMFLWKYFSHIKTKLMFSAAHLLTSLWQILWFKHYSNRKLEDNNQNLRSLNCKPLTKDFYQLCWYFRRLQILNWTLILSRKRIHIFEGEICWFFAELVNKFWWALILCVLIELLKKDYVEMIS